MLNAEERLQVATVQSRIRSCVVAVVLGVAAASPAAHDPIATKVTWEREIGPIVQARCVSCHTAGGRAPMALTTYEEARPWARAIREEVLARRMPKWPVVRGYGDFTNDRSLSPFEVALFAAWADGGAPRSLPAPASRSGTEPSAAEGSSLAAPALGLRAGVSAEHGAALAEAVGSDAGGASLRAVDLPCTARALPSGRLVALKPALRNGGDLRVTVTHADGSREPLLWLRGFDPEFAETYRLRRPVDVTRATRLAMEGPPPCRLTVLLEEKTAR